MKIENGSLQEDCKFPFFLNIKKKMRRTTIMGAKKEERLLFEWKGTPPLGTSFYLSLQHLVAMIVGCVTPAIIIANVVGLPLDERVMLIQASLVMSAVSTLFQLFPMGKRFGSGLPVILGVSFAYLPSMQSTTWQVE